jgi:hypothetical protein
MWGYMLSQQILDRVHYSILLIVMRECEGNMHNLGTVVIVRYMCRYLEMYS